MSDNKNHYRENSFTLSQSYTYTLLIQFEVQAFSYAVIYNYRLMAYGENCPFYWLNESGEINDILIANYKKVLIGLPAIAFTLVPKDLFFTDQVSAYARFLDVQFNEKVLAQTLDDKNVIIYKTGADIVQCAAKFNLANTTYTANGLAKIIQKSQPLANKLYLDIGNDLIQILYFQFGSLRFYNTFEVIDEDDLTYFAVLVAEQLNLDPRNTTLVVSGNINQDDNKFTCLSDFFDKIELNEISFIELPWHLTPHKMLAHASLLLCV